RSYMGRVPETNSKGQCERYGEHEIRASLRQVYSNPPRAPWLDRQRDAGTRRPTPSTSSPAPPPQHTEAPVVKRPGAGPLQDGPALVHDVESFIGRFLILPAYTTLPITLWAIATHGFELFDAFPYLLVTSPAPRCGKTRLLEILELVVHAPTRTANISEAALF